MTYIIERLGELRRYLDHLREIRSKVSDRAALEQNLSLKNDVLFSLLTVCQLVIDIAGEMSASRGERFGDYTEAIRSLSGDERFSQELVGKLERLPGFRNVVVHEYVALDLDRVIEALEELEPIEEFFEIVRSSQ